MTEAATLTSADIEKQLRDVYGLDVQSIFIPYSKSRHVADKWRSLNWRVTLLHGKRPILECDYSAGEGHCPSYKQGKRTIDEQHALDYEIETGHRYHMRAPVQFPSKQNALLPKFTDVIHSLVMDSSVLNYATFEDWAADYGYEPDSRKAEALYRECLTTGLKLRAGLGDKVLQEIRALFEDY